MRRRKWGAALWVASAAIAACVLGPQLSKTEQTAVIVGPASHNFGPVPVGATSSPLMITISPQTGNGDVMNVVEMVTDCAPVFDVEGEPSQEVSYSCNAGSGSAATLGVCEAKVATFVATFSPTTGGLQTCTVEFLIDTGGGSTEIVTTRLDGAGVPPQRALDVEPGEINFGGDVRIGGSGSQTLTVSNVGQAEVRVSSLGFAVGTPSIFSLTPAPTSPFDILPNAEVEYEVTCTPTAEGTVGSSIVIVSNANNSPITIPISCDAIDSQFVAIAPTFQARLGEMITRTVTITNAGTTTATIQDARLSETTVQFATAPVFPIPLAPLAVHEFQIQYTPTEETPAGPIATLTLDEGPGPVSNVNVILNGEAHAAAMATSPDVIDFGAICSGEQALMPVRVFALARGSFHVDSIAAPMPFTITPMAAFDVEGAPDLGVMVDAAVSASAPGDVGGMATFTTDLPGAALQQVSLRATALPPGISGAPAALDFGVVDLDGLTFAQTAELVNCTTTPLAFSSIEIAGADGGLFGLVAPVPPQVVPQRGKLAVGIVMSGGDVPGPKTGTLVFAHDTGTTEISLIGTTLDGEPVDPKEISYYTCSAGSPGAAIGIIVVVIAFRRRRPRGRTGST